jgi:hypothetical protein
LGVADGNCLPPNGRVGDTTLNDMKATYCLALDLVGSTAAGQGRSTDGNDQFNRDLVTHLGRPIASDSTRIIEGDLILSRCHAYDSSRTTHPFPFTEEKHGHHVFGNQEALSDTARST